MVKGLFVLLMTINGVKYDSRIYGVCACDVLDRPKNKECRIEDIGIMGAKGKGSLIAILDGDKALSMAKVKITCRTDSETFKDPFRRPM